MHDAGTIEKASSPVPAGDHDRAWQAVLDRDHGYDGVFVYAVTTTGIFCRPGCPARRPRRANVRFFSAPDSARRAGFRACRRCRPEDPSGSSGDATVAAARAYLDERDGSAPTLHSLAAAVGASPSYLQRAFTRRLGMSPRDYVLARRLLRFRCGVGAGADLLGATGAAGFGSSRGLYEIAGAGLGMTPGQYARGGAGLEIAAGVTGGTLGCDLGRVLVASTPAGICAVLLGDDDETLHAALAREFGMATITRNASVRRGWTDAVLAHLADTRTPLGVPLDYQGTPFQIRVWRMLRTIPPGERRTYSELAAAIGSPRAVRAVGRACGQNAIAVVVPCHRIVRKDGGLGGYRWGLDRKRTLLERERA